MVCELEGPGPALNNSKTEVVIGRAVCVMRHFLEFPRVARPFAENGPQQ
jgi:hypothetical protein